jgi:hypothetical protein
LNKDNRGAKAQEREKPGAAHGGLRLILQEDTLQPGEKLLCFNYRTATQFLKLNREPGEELFRLRRCDAAELPPGCQYFVNKYEKS